MKSKLFVLSLIVATGLFNSCKTEEPTETDWNNYVAALKHYYPYSLEDQFLFVNDSLGRTWEAQPYDDNKEEYPYTHILICKKEPGSKCSGDGTAYIYALFMNKGEAPQDGGKSEITTYITHEGGSELVSINWSIVIRLGADEYYRGELRESCPASQVLSHLADTIVIPASKDSYARIVKDKGLTDFCVDGKTVWQRKNSK